MVSATATTIVVRPTMALKPANMRQAVVVQPRVAVMLQGAALVQHPEQLIDPLTAQAQRACPGAHGGLAGVLLE